LNFFSLFKRNLIFKFKRKINIDNEIFNLNTLDELFYHYGSDKANIFKLNDSKGHGYSKFYTNELSNLKNKEINILELGSFAGASAAAFSKYFTNSRIFCFDINISNFKYTSKQISVYGLDIANIKKVHSTVSKIFDQEKIQGFDIIIDDGSHLLSDMLVSLSVLFDYLNSNGIYIIEDFKFPNYFKRNKNVNDILIDTLITKIQEKSYFKSNYIDEKKQKKLFDSVNSLSVYKGNLKESDICFIKKKH
tara:strand:- start:4588 stop:5334 length:747 start_codon:yes stop_codon:yes gene_type:complete